jgi:hypothetical protein
MTDAIDPKTLAANVLQLLQQDPRRYRCFGAYWWLIKALLKQFYTRDNLHLLGDYMPPDAGEHMAGEEDLQEALQNAVAEYRANAQFALGSAEVTDHGGGGSFRLVDPDAGGL